MKYKAEHLKDQEELEGALKLFKEIQMLINKMKNSKNKYQIKKEVESFMDMIYCTMIHHKIEIGISLTNKRKAINTFKKGMNITENIYDILCKEEQIKKVNHAIECISK